MRRTALMLAIVAVVAGITLVPTVAGAHGDQSLVTIGVAGGPLRYVALAGPPPHFFCTQPCWPAIYEESNGDPGLQLGFHCHPSGTPRRECAEGETLVPRDTRLTP